MTKKTSKQSLNEERPIEKIAIIGNVVPTTKAKPQPSKHNKNFPVQKVSKTKMLEVIANTKGRFFSSTHTGKDGNPHTINGIRYKKQDNEFGYIKVYCAAVKEMRLINPQTLTDVSFGGIHYQAKK